MKEINSHHADFLRLLEGLIDQAPIIAFSGGVDSTLLLKAVAEICSRTDVEVHAVTFHTMLHPVNDMEITRSLAREIEVSHHVIQIDELKDAGIKNNPVNRCYLCKKHLFTQLRKFADEIGTTLIMDGTNADDMQVYRPGIQALKELEIISPLAESGMTKDDIREMAASYGLSVANRPSSPCLATRFPYGTLLSQNEMDKVERGEEFLRSLGFYNVRLRVHGDIVRIEVDHIDLGMVLEHRESIINTLKKSGYSYVTLDLEGFTSGSMDKNIRKSNSTLES